MTAFQKPTNAIASEIVRLRSVDSDVQMQIDTLLERREEIASTIALIEPHATWETTEVDPPITDPELIPEPEINPLEG